MNTKFITYKKKIEVILNNRLGFNDEENNKHINDVKTWLCCEWQCDMIDMPVYILLIDEVNNIAQEIIEAF